MESERAAGFPLLAVLNGWGRAYLRPGVAIWPALVRGADWGRVALSVGLAGVLNGGLRVASSGLTGLGPLPAFVGGVLLTLVVFSVMAVLLLFMADRFRGQGDTVDHVYAVALIWAPLTILLGLPLVGDLGGLLGTCVGLPALLYATYLTYCAMRAVHGLADAAARVVAFAPLMLLFILFLIIWGTLFALVPNTLLVPLPTPTP